jgi:hypothetical protein
MSVGQPQSLLLQEFGDRIRAAFGAMAYQVGSSLESKTWRDVDVRLMLSREQWDRLGLGDPGHYWDCPRWRAFSIVFSDYGRHLTGLPIDFQIQLTDAANEEFKGKPRSALFAARSFDTR